MLQTLHTLCIFFSIAGIRLFVECGLQPCPSLDLFQQPGLGPAVLQSGPEIPCAFLAAFTALQNGHILRPAQLQGQRPQFLAICICTVKFPHPAQVAWGEALGLRIVCLEILSGHHRRALLRAGTDGPANLEVQLHLGQSSGHELIQCPIHSAVICGFPGIHALLLSGAPRLI